MRRGVNSPGEGRLRIFKLAIQIIQLEKEEVVLFEIQVLRGFEVNGYVIFDSEIEDVTEVIHHFLSIQASIMMSIISLPVLWMFKYHSEVWKKLLPLAAWCVQS